MRSTQSGTKITNFTLATSRSRLSEGRVMRDENGYRVMDTEWHRITCFNGLGKTVAEHWATIKTLLDDGIVGFETPRGALMLRFPSKTHDVLFPRLFDAV